METLHLGLDDTDSPYGGCTTHAAWRILRELDCDPPEPPSLVRLNPTVPWKTRGNGALALRLRVEDAEGAFEETVSVIEGLRRPGSDTGIVGCREDPRDEEWAEGLYRKGVTSVLERKDVAPLIGNTSMVESFGGGRGLLGASAALAWSPGDSTYELLAYRDGAREVDDASIRDAAAVKGVWDTLDPDGSPVCVPSTPCPVLLGLRGDSEEAVLEAWSRVKTDSVEGFCVFRTNQGTDDHVVNGSMGSLKPRRSYRVTGTVSGPPRTIEGGHVFFNLEGPGGAVDCAAYEPTKGFRDVVRGLREGDRLTVYGSYRESGGGTVNLERLEVLSLNRSELVNPTCPGCGRSMESAGRNQGYRCRRCGTRADSKTELKVKRELEEGFHEVPPSARRHLSKPLRRF
ncbi:MAG: tRNA(Ile2) 2-agmatinylcytidine synthetase TiaS [Methanonatronarchaeales archaeon]|nr:tRNA(Ile2) 2-agmatinylcytidine synthetase TiaS [Methanonatronarchaeales archaeon]